MAIKVKLREKKITGNRQSLYLDFYPAIPHPETGEPTRREFLGMYLFDKAKNPIDKQGNKETLQLAEQIRQKRENYLNKSEIYTGYEKEQLKIKEQGEQNFVTYFKSLADKRKASNHDNWVSAKSGQRYSGKYNVSSILSGRGEIILKIAQQLRNYFQLPASVFFPPA